MSVAQAVELRVQKWIDADGAMRPPLRLAELGTGWKVLYCFQHWCEGCHAHGFPTLQRLVSALSSRGVGFAVIQTVFEGEDENTFERLRETQLRYGLAMPFGHDHVPGRHSTVMDDYHTGGTPWFIVIDPDGNVAGSGFRVNASALIELIERA
jgi:AhpC/TSA family